jgi:hypothetical protein
MEDSIQKHLFIADHHFIGAPKRSPIIQNYASYLKQRVSNGYYTSEHEFAGYSAHWLNYEVKKQTIKLIDGMYIGIKNVRGKPILIEELMEEQPLELYSSSTYGILIPMEEMLKRTKYQWFSVMNMSDILKNNTIISKYINHALIDEEDPIAHEVLNKKPVINI